MTRLAPFALLRVAALGYGSLLRMTPLRTGEHLERALAARRTMAGLEQEVESVVFALVGRAAAEDLLRRQALALKRDVHNGRAPRPGVADRVRGALSIEERRPLEKWLAARDRLSTELHAAAAALREETETHIRGGLRALLADDLFLRAIAVASPQLSRKLHRAPAESPRNEPTRAERSLLRYALRAAAKTSPFSCFMHQGPVEVRPADESARWELDAAVRLSRSVVERGFLLQVVRTALLNGSSGSLSCFRVNPTVRAAAADRLEALASEYVMVKGRAWRTDEVVSLRCPSALLHALVESAGAAVGRAELLDLIVASGVEAGNALPLLAKLVDLGVVREAPWTDALDPHPEAGALARIAVAEVAGAVSRLSTAAAELATVEGRAREGALREMGGMADGVLATLGVAARRRPEIVSEDGILDGVRGALGRPWCEQLTGLAPWLRERAVAAPEYTAMRQRFIAAFGRGGRCVEVVPFLLDVLRRPASGQPPPLRSAKPVAVTLFVQTAASELVINRVVDGIGWLAARHAEGGLVGQARLRGWLADWLVRAMSPREPVDMLGRGECSNLQQHPRLTRRILGWPSEPVRDGTPDVVPLESCSLVHDLATDDLDLRDADDVPLAPVYLGGTFAAGFDLMNLLRVLAQPAHVPWPPPEAPPTGSAAVVFRPRMVRGSVILRRQSWWVRSRHLRANWFAQRGAARLFDVAAERVAHGIPEVFFAELPALAEADRFAALPPAHRKPLWVDSRNPWCLELLERLALYSRWMVLREMLPDAADLSAEIDGERCVSELHCEMVVPWS